MPKQIIIIIFINITGGSRKINENVRMDNNGAITEIYSYFFAERQITKKKLKSG